MILPAPIRKEFPFKNNFFQQHTGLQIHYVDEGKNEHTPTVFLHGNPTWSFFYRNLILSLQHHFRCIAPDHIGCGLSDKPKLDKFKYDLQSHSENFNSLLEHLKLEKFNLVVHDWGGAIGLSALKDNLSRINKLVLLNTAAFNSSDVPIRIRFCRLPVIGELFVRGMNGFARPATWMATKKGLSKSSKAGFLFPYKSWSNRIATWRFVKDIPLERDHSTRAFLQATEDKIPELVNTPTLACWGMQDFCFHEGFLNQWKSRIPNIDINKFQNAGHYLLEDNFEGCEKVIKSFLTT
jgi:haloalkane dehalogenase